MARLPRKFKIHSERYIQRDLSLLPLSMMRARSKSKSDS